MRKSKKKFNSRLKAILGVVGLMCVAFILVGVSNLDVTILFDSTLTSGVSLAIPALMWIVEDKFVKLDAGHWLIQTKYKTIKTEITEHLIKFKK